VIERYVFLEDDNQVLDRRLGSRPEEQVACRAVHRVAPVCCAAFAPVIVAPTVTPTPMTVAAATAA
jgi:hypothetical protein